jgi:DNA-binding helix-hairpin-helix protein with protein kinase domain
VVDPALERALGSQFSIVRLLGRGGMGTVYLARDTALDRLVAVKVLPPDGGDTTERRERFRREARTAARLNHPGIVPLHTYGELDGTLYFVMGYVRGESLAARLARDGRLSAADARRLLAALAEALAYAHQRGVVHRDVKPDNVLLDDESGRPLLADFGVAKAQGAGRTLTESGGVIGTPHYMSPEQASGRADVDARSDLYSLGVIGYRMLAGRLPFEGKDPRDVLMQHLTQAPPPLATVAPGLPDDLASAVMRCLAKEPDRRWPDARSLADAFRGDAADDSSSLAVPWIAWPVLWCLWVAYLVYLNTDVPTHQYLVTPAGFAFVLTLPLLVPLVGGYKAAFTNGATARAVAQAAIRAPAWWIGWYPRRWRRPGDVWQRLPRRIRRLRLMVTVLFLLLGLFVFPSLLGLYTTATTPWANAGTLWLAGNVLVYSLLASMLLCGVLAVDLLLASRWANGQGLDIRDRHRLFFDERTSGSAFWTRPQVAALLTPAPTTEPKTPSDHVGALESILRRLDPSRREPAEEALAAVRRVVAGMRQMDDELARMGTIGETGALEKLEAQLRAVGDGELRELLTRQLEATRAVAARFDEARERRRQLAELLAKLWVEVRALESGGEPDRLRDVCAEIRRSAGAAETPGSDELSTLPH